MKNLKSKKSKNKGKKRNEEKGPCTFSKEIEILHLHLETVMGMPIAIYYRISNFSKIISSCSLKKSIKLNIIRFSKTIRLVGTSQILPYSNQKDHPKAKKVTTTCKMVEFQHHYKKISTCDLKLRELQAHFKMKRKDSLPYHSA